MNVIEERIPFNVHFKTPTAPTYMEQLKQMKTDGLVSLRGLRKDATLFNEIVIDVNTMYFERNGGYEYAKQFYEEAFHFIEEKFGADNIISAVMHADEINAAATEELGKEVYHYHLHAMVLPVVEKEILWSKRCKDEKLRGTVKEVVHQISHSKKWKSDIPLTDEKGNPLLRKNGKPMFRASYSILQDELLRYPAKLLRGMLNYLWQKIMPLLTFWKNSETWMTILKRKQKSMLCLPKMLKLVSLK